MGNRAIHFKTMILYAITASLDAGDAGPPSRQKFRNWWRNAVKPSHLLLFVAASLATALPSVLDARAQGEKSGVERLYILNCGEGIAGDISRWSPGVNV